MEQIRTLTILRAILRGRNANEVNLNLNQVDFDLSGSTTYDLEVKDHNMWTVKSFAEQRRIFSLKDVHIEGVPRFAVLPNVRGLASVEELSLVMDLDGPLLCQGNPAFLLCTIVSHR